MGRKSVLVEYLKNDLRVSLNLVIKMFFKY